MSEQSTKFIDPEQIKKDVHVTLADLDDAMVKHASLFVMYASKSVQARRQVDRLKNAVEILKAKLYRQVREVYVAEGKKATEAQIDADVLTNQEYINAVTKLIDAKADLGLCEVAESAFVQRRDLILELARDRRKEREGQLRVMSNNDQRDLWMRTATEHAGKVAS